MVEGDEHGGSGGGRDGGSGKQKWKAHGEARSVDRGTVPAALFLPIRSDRTLLQRTLDE
jgi:hypothetical protein